MNTDETIKTELSYTEEPTVIGHLAMLADLKYFCKKYNLKITDQKIVDVPKT